MVNHREKTPLGRIVLETFSSIFHVSMLFYTKGYPLKSKTEVL